MIPRVRELYYMKRFGPGEKGGPRHEYLLRDYV